jgi:hypothetical protein
MSRLSPKYAPHLLALLVLVAIPVYVHQGGRSYVDDCADPLALRDHFDFDTPHPLVDRPEQLNYFRTMWLDGHIDYGDPVRGQLKFSVARSFRPSYLYLDWHELRPGFIEPEDIKLRYVDVDGERLPVQVLVGRDQSPPLVAAYILVYNNRPVERPFLTQLRASFDELFSTLPPMTMYFVTGQVARRDLEIAEQRAVEWLANGWRQFRSICSPPAGA